MRMSLSIGKGWEGLCWLLALVSNTWCQSGVVMGLQKHLQHHALPAANCRASGACATGASTTSTTECCRSSTYYYVCLTEFLPKPELICSWAAGELCAGLGWVWGWLSSLSICVLRSGHFPPPACLISLSYKNIWRANWKYVLNSMTQGMGFCEQPRFSLEKTNMECLRKKKKKVGLGFTLSLFSH